jgi:hypothetical protein
MENIFWTGFSNGPRHEVISEIQNIVSRYGAIVDFKQFSDISLSLCIEIEELKIDSLRAELNQILGLDQSEAFNSVSKKERTIYLNITFNKGSGNLKIEVPAVPG